MNRRVAVLLLLVLLGGGASPALAAGLAILEQSPEGTGLAGAGGVTGYGDGSAVFLNPAAMIFHRVPTAAAGLHFVAPQAAFSQQGSPPDGRPLTGPDGGNGAESWLMPNFYGVSPLSSRLALGLGFNLPYGLETDYPHDWAGRYQALHSAFRVARAGGAAAYEILPGFSLGAGLGALYAEASLSQAIDFGSLGAAAFGAPQAAELGLFPQRTDGSVEMQGRAWGLGWNLGAVYAFGEGRRSRIGAAFSGRTAMNLHGQGSRFSLPEAARIFASSGAFTDTDSRADFTLPESVNFGARHPLSRGLELLYESQWTNWSVFDEMRVRFENPAQPDAVTPQSWRPAWRHSLGARLQLAEAWELTAGAAYDRTPIPDAAHRTPRLPDNDRWWAAAGLCFRLAPDADLRLSYAHLFMPDGREDTLGPAHDRLQGEWRTQVDILSLGLIWRWDQAANTAAPG